MNVSIEHREARSGSKRNRLKKFTKTDHPHRKDLTTTTGPTPPKSRPPEFAPSDTQSYPVKLKVRRKFGQNRSRPMDDLYAINAAKTEFREAFNQGDPRGIIAIAHPDLINFSDGQPSEFGETGLQSFKRRLEKLFADYTAQLSVIVIEIRMQSDVAQCYGWHGLTLTPRRGGEPIHRRSRYVDIWRKNTALEWKLWIYVDNADVADPFVPEDVPPAKPKAYRAQSFL